MKVLNTFVSLTTSALLLAVGGRAITGDKKTDPPKHSIPDTTPKAAPFAPFLVAQLDKKEKVEEPKLKPVPLYSEKFKEFAYKDMDSMLAYELMQNHVVPLTEKDIKTARENKNTMFAMAVAMRLPKKDISKEDIDNSRMDSKTKFNFGLLRNLNRKLEKKDIEMAKESFKGIHSPRYFGAILSREDYPITDDERKLTEEYQNTWSAEWIGLNPNYIRTIEDQKIFYNCPNSWIACSLGENPSFILTPQAFEVAIKNPTSWGAQSLFRNPRHKTTPAHIAWGLHHHSLGMALSKTPYFNPLYSEYKIGDSDRTFAESKELNTSFYAYRTTIDPENRSPNMDFVLKNPDCAYSIGTIRNFNTKFTEEHIAFALKNPNTYAAYEMGKRLNKEQITKKVRDEVSGKLMNTRFAKGIGQNYYFAEPSHQYGAEIPSHQKTLVRKYPFGNMLAEGIAMNIAYTNNSEGELTEDDKKAIKGEFVRSTIVAFNLTRNQNWGKVTKADEDFIINNYKCSTSLGLSGSQYYEASLRIREFAKKLTKSNPNERFLYHLTKNMNYIKSLNAKDLASEIEFAIENKESEYARGLFENNLLFATPKILKLAFENPNSSAAKGIAQNPTLKITPQIKDFVRGTDNAKDRNTWFTNIVVGSDIYIPNERDFEIMKEDPRTHFAFAMRWFNDSSGFFAPYIKHKHEEN